MSERGTWLSSRLKAWQLYTLMFLPLVYLIVFKYYPMLGAQIAFKNFNLVKGIWGSPWVGFKHFDRFLKSYQFVRVMRNTLVISFYQLIAGFPLPIILALGLNYLKSARYKKIVQMVTYAPYFISTVVMVSIIMQVLHPRTGLLNLLITSLGWDAVNFMGEEQLFKSIYVWSGIWQYTGYSAILYIAALAGIDPTLYEAGKMDGVSRFKRIIYIDLPGIAPTIIILLILNTGNLMNIGFEKIFLMQNDLNLVSSEIISTYIYKIGLRSAQFSYSTAIGFFNSIINFVLLVTVNRIARKHSEVSLW